MIDLRIKNPTIVSPWGEARIGHVDITDGKIHALGNDTIGSAARVIDADGRFLLPGFIDTHVHLNFLKDSEYGGDDVNEFLSETRAAAAAGVTTMMVYYRALEPYGDDLRSFIESGRTSSWIDFGIHLGILIQEHLDRLSAYSTEFGILSFKMYTCYKDAELRRFGVAGEDDGFILDVLRHASTIPGALVHIHAENEEITQRATDYVKNHLDEYDNPIAAWSAARPVVAEAEAIRRVAFLAGSVGCRLFIPHLSSALGLEEIRQARKVLGRDRLLCETCPQYLLRSTESPPSGNLGKVNPPIRTSADSEALIGALANGEIDVVGTDHATTVRAAKTNGTIIEARPGFPGLATVFPALMTLVSEGRMPIARLAQLSQRSAELFHLEKKGLITPGFDADLVLVDPAIRRVVDPATLGSASDFSIFEGVELAGWPVATIVGGRVISEDGDFVVHQPKGRYLHRSVESTGRPVGSPAVSR